MKICIDCRLIDSGGLGTFIRGILRHLISQREHSFLLIGDSSRLAVYESPNVSVSHCNLPIFSVREQVGYPYHDVNRCDAYIAPNYNLPWGIRIPIYTVIHDVLYMDMPYMSSWIGRMLRKQYLRLSMKLSRHIFTVSHFSRARIITHFPGVKSVSVCHNGLDETFTTPIVKPSALPEWITAPYYLYVGNLKPHKGIDTLVEAFETLPGDYRLIIAGSGDNFRSGINVDTLTRIERNVSMGRIILPGHVDQNTLLALYANATALIQPSVYEGFGIPPLEAMSMGTQAVISDIEVFREIYSGFPVTYFRAGDPSSLASTLLALDRNKHISLSSELKEKYSYRATAQHILDRITNQSAS